MKKVLFLSLITGFAVSLFSQAADSTGIDLDDYFKEKIAAYEGISAPIFRATDLSRNHHYLDKYKDNIVILHFWQVYSPSTTSQIPSLNRIVKEYYDQGVIVLGFADDDEQEVSDFIGKNLMYYPVIPNAMEFARAHFGGELGYPRTFIIDKYGVIQKVSVGGNPDLEMELYEEIKLVIEEHLRY